MHPHRIHGAGIYANIWGILMVNVTIYSIHGSYGIWMEKYGTNCAHFLDRDRIFQFSRPQNATNAGDFTAMAEGEPIRALLSHWHFCWTRPISLPGFLWTSTRGPRAHASYPQRDCSSFSESWNHWPSSIMDFRHTNYSDYNMGCTKTWMVNGRRAQIHQKYIMFNTLGFQGMSSFHIMYGDPPSRKKEQLNHVV